MCHCQESSGIRRAPAEAPGRGWMGILRDSVQVRFRDFLLLRLEHPAVLILRLLQQEHAIIIGPLLAAEAAASSDDGIDSSLCSQV